MSFHTRSLRRDELVILAGWMYEETWHVSINILQSCYDIDPMGWIAAVTSNGEFIGSITGCILDADIAFGGFFIVNPKWRRKGVGKLLWKTRMEYLGGRNFGIDAVEGRIEYDRANGFEITSLPIAAYSGIPNRDLLRDDSPTGFKVTEMNSDLFHQVWEYDTNIHIIPRKAFLTQWTKRGITKTYCALVDDKIIGYGCVQPIEGGNYHIGPLFADNQEVANNIMVKLLLHVPEGKAVGFDIPVDNELSMNIAKIHGMHLELKFNRMYTKNEIEFQMEKVYAYTTMGIALV